MHTYSKKTASRQTTAFKSRNSARAQFGESREANSHHKLQQMIGNHTSQVELQLQPKLTVNTPGDMFEQEADRIADQVMRFPETRPQSASACNGGCSQHEVTQPMAHELIQSPGNRVDSATRAFFEPRFNHDFSKVRVHTGGDAIQMSESIGAAAFTYGNDIYFNNGQYKPESRIGKHILAHELTHTLQQKNSVQKKVQRMTKAEALKIGKELNINYPGWLSKLPDCPCSMQDMRDENIKSKKWEDETSILTKNYHPGAKWDIRSAQGYSSVSGTSHGQQCCYDPIGELITHGPGAGTPDVWRPEGLISSNTFNHKAVDVDAFEALGWAEYTKYWKPNQGIDCSSNRGYKRTYRVIAEHDPLGGASPVPYTVTSADDVQVQETGKNDSLFDNRQVVPINFEAFEVFRSWSPRWLPIEILYIVK